MSGKSTIQWTAGDDGSPGATWNPIIGCSRVSDGCNFCYAFALHDQRHIAWKRRRYPTAPAQYHQPFSKVQLLPERLRDPYHWRAPRRVFVNSVSDLFHPDVPSSYILDIWLTMAANPRHTFQILTKRPERMGAWCRETFAAAPTLAMLPNVWLGVSVEDQAAADERIPLLLDTPAATRFLSCEPLLGPIDLAPACWVEGKPRPPLDVQARQWRASRGGLPSAVAALDWVIVGGESGPHARVMNPRWALALIEQCRTAGVAVFCKQMGTVWAKANKSSDNHGGNPLEWSEELRVREFPHQEAVHAN